MLRALYRKILPLSVRRKLALAQNLKKASFPLREKLSLFSKRKLRKIRFQVDLTSHCNLNCRGCSHFAPLSAPSFVKLEDFSRDMERMGDLFHHECEWIDLMGGEPLLHPEIAALIAIARKNFPHGQIRIVTNGILLSQMDEAFWRACHDHGVKILITHYPIVIDIQKIASLAQEFGVKYDWYGAPDEKARLMVLPIDLSGKMNGKKNFVLCDDSNNCIALRQGYLYSCNFASNVHIFNETFGTDIQVTEEDRINIYEENDKDVILHKLRSPTPVCRYCDRDHRRPVKWAVSKREMSEWL